MQLRILPERAQIDAPDLSQVRCNSAEVEEVGTLGVPSITYEARGGPHYTRLTRYLRLYIVYDRLDSIQNRSDIEVVDLLPESGCR